MDRILALVASELGLTPSISRSFALSCSGGPDSMALAHILVRLSNSYPIHLNLVHINYGLRGEESQRDENCVREFAKKFELSLLVHPVRQGLTAKSVQEQARKIRLKLSQQVLTSSEWIEAHHADDQLETFLFRAFRGASPDGLVGLRKKFQRMGRSVQRPLLSLRKRDLIDYCLRNKVPYEIDRSNLQSVYSRNQIRNIILPLIERYFPSARENLETTRRLIAEDAEYLNDEALSVWNQIFDQNALRRPIYCGLAKPLRKRCLKMYFQAQMGLIPPGSRMDHLDAQIIEAGDFIWNAPKGYWVHVEATKIKLIKPKELENEADLRGLSIT